MIKRILLAIVTLAIIMSCYMLYTMLLTPRIVEEPVHATERMALPTQPAGIPSRSVPFTSPELAVLSGEGQSPKFERYGPDGRIVYQFQCDHWRPSETNPGKYDMERPELRIFLRGGQILQVSATEGEIETLQGRGTRLEPKGGVLHGKVHVFIDRATDPDRSAPEQRPEDIMHIWVDRLDFDLSRNILESSDPIRIELEEAELIGEGIHISWNQLTNQIEDITIQRGDRLVIRQGFDMLSPEMPFTPEASTTQPVVGDDDKSDGDEVPSTAIEAETVAGPIRQDTAAPKPPTPEAPMAEVASVDAADESETAPSTQPRAARSYDLFFDSNVNIVQYENRQTTGTMQCDRLHIIFDIPHSSERQSTVGDSPERQRKLSQDDRRIEIFWDGPLRMIPTELPYSPDRRFHIVATGQPVRIDQGDEGSVRCRKLEFYQESRQLRLHGTTDEPVSVTQGEGRTIVAPFLFYDRENGIASGKGPGFMKQRSGVGKSDPDRSESLLALSGPEADEKAVMLFWQESFYLNLGEYERMTPEGLQTRQYLKRAEFRGDARMQRPGEVMSGDRVVLTFLAPEHEEQIGETIETLHAEKNVLLQSDHQRITCDVLDVEFGEGNYGRIPKFARAGGNVVAKDRQRIIQADLLTTVMEDVAITPAISSTQPHPDQAGLVGEVAKPRARVVVREVGAGGNVMVRDPDQPMSIDSQKMHALIDPDGSIRWFYMEGEDQTWAKAVLRDYAISGMKVTMDLTTEQIDIPGPGELQFVNRQDLEGTRTAQPVPIAINWSESMKLTGGKRNLGTFFGDIKVRSDKTTLYCGVLNVDFENIPEEEKIDEPSTDRFWIFSRLMGQTTEEKPTVELPIARKRPSYIQAFAKEGERVAVQYLVREADRLISRTTLWGDELTMDLVSNRMNVPGGGQLSIEDYQLPRQGGEPSLTEVSSRASSGLGDPFGGDFQTAGPSQTGFEWTRGLTYLLDSRTAIFDGMVEMRHLSGPDLLRQQGETPQETAGATTREAKLSCDNLKVEFLRGGFGFTDQVDSGATELKNIVATGSVYLQEKPRSIMANRLMYNRVDNMIVVYGTEPQPAYLDDANEKTGQITIWEGPLIIWDRNKNEIHAPDAKIITTLR